MYGTDEADVPIQLALWSAPTVDPRFQETEEQPVSVLFPHGAEVVATFGQLIGCKGKVIGPHGPTGAGNARSSLRKAKTKQGASDAAAAASSEAKGESVEESKGNNDSATATGDKSAADKKSRVVDVEFYVLPPEPPFGHASAQSIQEEYFPARDVCRSLGISPSVLGKIVGSIFVEPGRYDLGLNLKRNGQYQLLGYVRKVSYENSAAHGEPSNGASAAASKAAAAWGHGDTVQVVGMIDSSKQADAAESVQWEYSAKALALLFDYKTKFPMLFDNLERLPHQKKYPAHELVPPSAVLPPAEGKPLDPTAGAEVVKEWMKLQPFFAMPRTPLTTVSLSR